jgi:glycosyltransferase involved in cell wall biosynthesis
MQRNVSVILPVYQKVGILRVVLEHLDAQRFSHPWELIVCDDGSDEDILGAVRAHVRNSRIRVVYAWQQHKGFRAGQSRNNGLRLATGNLMVLLDGDIVVGPDFIERHYAAHSDNNHLVCGSRRWLGVSDTTLFDSSISNALADHENSADVYSESCGQARHAGSEWAWLSCMSCNCSFYRTGAIFFDEGFVGWGFEDDDFAFRLYHEFRYDIDFRPDIWGLHLEAGLVRRTPLRPSSHEEIELFLRNLLRFTEKHGGERVFPAIRCIAHFEMHDGRWRVAQSPSFEDDNIRRLLGVAAEWFRFPESVVVGSSAVSVPWMSANRLISTRPTAEGGK